jgi:hypothetical protein
MKMRIRLWVECRPSWEAEGLPLDSEIEVTGELLLSISERWDLQILNYPDARKLLCVAPLGRGFRQRG